MSGPLTLRELRAWAEAAPRGATVPVDALAEMLADFKDETWTRVQVEGPSEPVAPSWRERLWTCPAETRLGIHELSQALNKPKSWIYRRTSAKAGDRLPHRKLGGELLFTAGEIRAWLREHEAVIQAGPMESTAAERQLRAVR